MKTEIVCAQSLLNVGVSPAMDMLRRALTGSLSGKYRLEPLHNGRASAPHDVSVLTVGPACKEGVALFFPNGSRSGIGCLLAFEKAHGRAPFDPIRFQNRLAEAILDIDEDDKASLGTEPSLSKTSRQETRVTRLFDDAPKLDLLHSTLVEIAKAKRRGVLIKKAILAEVRKIYSSLASSRDIGMFFAGLVERGLIERANTNGAGTHVGAPYRILPMSKPELHEPEEVPPQFPVLPVSVEPETPSPQSPVVSVLSLRIADLLARREALRSAHEEFLRIEGALADIEAALERLNGSLG